MSVSSALLLAAAPPSLLQPVEERRPVVVARCLDLCKQPKLGAESINLQNLAEMIKFLSKPGEVADGREDVLVMRV